MLHVARCMSEQSPSPPTNFGDRHGAHACNNPIQSSVCVWKSSQSHHNCWQASAARDRMALGLVRVSRHQPDDSVAWTNTNILSHHLMCSMHRPAERNLPPKAKAAYAQPPSPFPRPDGRPGRARSRVAAAAAQTALLSAGLGGCCRAEWPQALGCRASHISTPHHGRRDVPAAAGRRRCQSASGAGLQDLLQLWAWV